jgi:hypothetical protein
MAPASLILNFNESRNHWRDFATVEKLPMFLQWIPCTASRRGLLS